MSMTKVGRSIVWDLLLLEDKQFLCHKIVDKSQVRGFPKSQLMRLHNIDIIEREDMTGLVKHLIHCWRKGVIAVVLL